jgi:hypothetical protein
MATKNEQPEFVSARSVFVRGKNVTHYFAGYDGGFRLVKITKRAYERFQSKLDKLSIGHMTARKLGGKSANGHGTTPGAGHCWPLKCEALACHKSQVEGFRKAYKERGVNVEVRKDGMVIVPDEGAYKRLRKVHGAFHRNSFNG